MLRLCCELHGGCMFCRALYARCTLLVGVADRRHRSGRAAGGDSEFESHHADMRPQRDQRGEGLFPICSRAPRSTRNPDYPFSPTARILFRPPAKRCDMQHYVRQMRSLEKCTRENDPDGSKVRQGGGMPSPASRTASCWPRPHPCGRCRVAGCATCCSKERQTLLQLRGGSISGSRWLCRRLGLGRWASASPRGLKE